MHIGGQSWTSQCLNINQAKKDTAVDSFGTDTKGDVFTKDNNSG